MQNLPFVISIIAGMLWAMIFLLLTKAFGVPWPSRLQQEGEARRKLRSTQYVCVLGALSFGLAMFISSIVDNYLEGKVSGSVPHKSVAWIVWELVWWLAFGCLFGWFAWGRRQRS